ncbi:LOW QUALITY PROTEIN: glutamate receptor 3-like isoform X3, partial [Vespula squamosa]
MKQILNNIRLYCVCKNWKLAIYTSEQLNRIDMKVPCNLVPIETGDVYSFAVILSKHNPFTDIINFQIPKSININFHLMYTISLTWFSLQKYIDNGMINRFKYRFKEESSDIIKHQSVPLINVITLIVLFSIGIVLSTCLLIIEKCIFVRRRKNKSMVHRMPSIKSSVYHLKKKKIIGNITKNYRNNKYAR